MSVWHVGHGFNPQSVPAHGQQQNSVPLGSKVASSQRARRMPAPSGRCRRHKGTSLWGLHETADRKGPRNNLARCSPGPSADASSTWYLLRGAFTPDAGPAGAPGEAAASTPHPPLSHATRRHLQALPPVALSEPVSPGRQRPEDSWGDAALHGEKILFHQFCPEEGVCTYR